MVADGNLPPIDKACGEGLMPHSIAAAARIGIRLPEDSGFRFPGVRFHGEGRMIASEFPQGYGLGLRRIILHEELVKQAHHVGVDMLWGTPVTGIGGNTVQLNGRSVSTRWIIGADGSASRVRRWAGLDSFSRNSRRFAHRQHFACQPWTDHMEIYWGEACQIYVTPVANNEICAAVISRKPELRLADALKRFPLLEAHLAGVPASSSERGAVTANCGLKNVTRGSVALIGDASGSVDAITGEGLCQAFQQSAALADAIAREDLTHYEKAHRRIGLRPALMADMMLTMDRWPFIRRRALAAMAGQPACFTKLLAGHVGALTPFQMATAAMILGWRMVCV